MPSRCSPPETWKTMRCTRGRMRSPTASHRAAGPRAPRPSKSRAHRALCRPPRGPRDPACPRRRPHRVRRPTSSARARVHHDCGHYTKAAPPLPPLPPLAPLPPLPMSSWIVADEPRTATPTLARRSSQAGTKQVSIDETEKTLPRSMETCLPTQKRALCTFKRALPRDDTSAPGVRPRSRGHRETADDDPPKLLRLPQTAFRR